MNDAAANLLLVMSVCLIIMAGVAIRKGWVAFLIFMAILAAIYVIMYSDEETGKPAAKEPDMSILAATKKAWADRKVEDR